MSRLWGAGPKASAASADARRLAERDPLAQMSGIRFSRIALSWQLDVNWWRTRIYRDYYKVLAGGMALVIYHDLLTDAWAIQRVYD